MIATDKRKLLEIALPDESFFLLIGKSQTRRNGDVFYPFRQDSDILLLTGVSSPDIVLTGYKSEGKVEWRIFSDPISSHEILWGTERLSHQQIVHISGIESVYPMNDISEYIASQQSVSYIVTSYTRENPYISNFGEIPPEILSISSFLEPLRMIKTPEEIDRIRHAIAITEKAEKTLRKSLHSGMYEYEIEAIIAGVFRSHHMTEAYPTIVASGPNACTLHYTAHTRQIQEGDLVLVDFGAEYEGYAADITRVFPVGAISERQRQIYESVLEVQTYAKSLIRPGVQKLEFEKMVREKTKNELKKLGLIQEGLSGDDEEKLSRKYFPHSVSHFLGLDVHDTGSRDAVFVSGMVITCEPGIYIEEENIGIRLEDDIGVTENGCENLSKNIPLSLE